MIGMQVACDEAKGHRLIRRTLNLTRAEHPGRIAIEQQAQQHFGGIRFPTARSIVGIQRGEIKLGHAIYNEGGEMVGRQTVAQPYRQIECLVIVHFFEGSTHTQQYSMTDERHQFLSDKLLGPVFIKSSSSGDELLEPSHLLTATVVLLLQGPEGL